ncbi:hypothetical protein TeGR_g2125 [Tetraparma gracilis]|uniref:Uncharacterized protein n=1 Tax=Tetraparma gracilis TaxID=2962635 RepID=A0ABQ6MRF9_9STRA|nr:hypothetical protein TeGR_g2125 [Tetraparma gracilis]
MQERPTPQEFLEESRKAVPTPPLIKVVGLVFFILFLWEPTENSRYFTLPALWLLYQVNKFQRAFTYGAAYKKVQEARARDQKGQEERADFGKQQAQRSQRAKRE